jgi:hypothetical protein
VRTRQPSLFGVEATDPAPEDLAGLLAGPGELGRMGGTARVCVTVDAAWRVHALMDEFARRDLPAGWEDGFVVRTAYTARLVPLAETWRDGPPAGLHLGGQALRLWVAASGAPSPDGYLLRLGGTELAWQAIGAALAAAGLSAALVLRGDPAYRVTGRRRLARLAELVGEPPPAAPPTVWPG